MKQNHQSARVKKCPVSPLPPTKSFTATTAALGRAEAKLVSSASLIQILCGGAVAASDIISADKVRSSTPSYSYHSRLVSWWGFTSKNCSNTAES